MQRIYLLACLVIVGQVVMAQSITEVVQLEEAKLINYETNGNYDLRDVIGECAGGITIPLDTDKDDEYDLIRSYGASTVSIAQIQELGRRANSVQRQFAKNNAMQAVANFVLTRVDTDTGTEEEFSLLKTTSSGEVITFSQKLLNSIKGASSVEIANGVVAETYVVDYEESGEKCVIVIFDAPAEGIRGIP